MATPSEWLTRHVQRDHDWLLDRLRSLDNCLENLFYYGEVCSDLRGFGGLHHRCQELRETLKQHFPEEEELFARLESNSELRPVLARLVKEHRNLADELERALQTCEALLNGDVLPEDLFELQDRMRTLIVSMQRHIDTENQKIFPRLND